MKITVTKQGNEISIYLDFGNGHVDNPNLSPENARILVEKILETLAL